MDPMLQRQRLLADGTPITLYRIGVIVALSGRSVTTVHKVLADGRIREARYRQRREGSVRGGTKGDRYFTRDEVLAAVAVLGAPRPRPRRTAAVDR